jgi:phenylalanyl-tRNA synthetase beta chain
MRAPVSWIREYVDLPADVTPAELARRLTMLGLKLEALVSAGDQISGPLVIGRVLTLDREPQKNGKTICWCTVDVGDANGTGEPQGIVCGAHNFEVGDLVVVILPGGVLPGNFEISARKTYGHVSAGMICSSRELGLGEDHEGIIVLPAGAGEPGEDARRVLGLDDTVIEFEINPDRAYGLSLRGIARDAALGFGVGFHDPADRTPPAANDRGYPVFVEDPDGCPVFVARAVTGFDPSAPTPDWMVRRLAQCGVRSISLGVDITNYVMLETGQPIHGFDRSKLAGPIVVRRGREGEKVTTLDGTVRDISTEDLLITDDSGPIGLAGVMGGETTELSGTTTDILVEAANWHPPSIYRTERRHKLPSEASRRFERGVDPELPEAAADRVVELLAELGGGTIEDGVTVVGAPPERRTVSADSDLPARVTGMEIPPETAVAHLEAVGCDVVLDGSRLTATVPPWRPDLSDPFDLVEEVARVQGYDRVPSVLPPAPSGGGLTRGQRLRRRVGRTLAGAGYVEVVSFPFVGSRDFDDLGLPADDERRTTLRLANPLSSEEPAMTTTLLPGLLKAAARNAGRGNPDVALFESATVTLPRAATPAPILSVDRRPTDGELDELDKALPDQPLHLAVVLGGLWERPGWWGPGRPAGWAEAVAAVREVADALGVPVSVHAQARAPWHPGRCAEFRAGDVVVGHAGELHPRVCEAYGVPARSAAAEIDLDVLLERAEVVVPAPSFSNYPPAKEDVALVVDVSVPAADVEAALRDGAGELLESIRLFDLYTGDQAGPGKKSLAFALRFRAPDRTLTEHEAAEARDAAVALAAERTGAVQRT